MRNQLFLTFLLCLLLFLMACHGAETKPVKGNVLKAYVEVPLQKAKGMKAEVEGRQNEAKDMMDAVDK